MLLSMAVTLYTSRVVLNTLGVENFGIYNVVGGIVIALGFLNFAMAVSTQRFLTFELGKSDFKQLKRVFDTSVTIHVIIALIVFVLAETIGLWFLNYYLKIPARRIFAANWVYQFSIYSFMVTVISVPYNAAIIANERMKLFAFVGILEVILKLIIVYILVLFSFDKLILYSFLVFGVTLVIRLIYGVYCKKYFEECRRYRFFWDKDLINKIGKFASWNILGVSAGLGYSQGVNILLNVFLGPVINAARGIAFQVQSAMTNFVNNFQLAVDPSITKMYAKGDNNSTLNLVFRASKFSFFLVLFLSMPLIIETHTVLKFWLKIVPDYTVIFTRLVLIDILIGSLSGSLQILAQATGNIKRYQIVVSGILLLNLPTSYIFLKLNFPPEVTMIISIFYSCLALIMRLSILNKIADFPVKDFLVTVITKVVIVTIFASAIPIFIYFRLSNDNNLKFYIILVISIISISLTIFVLGLNSGERNFLRNSSMKLLRKINS